MMNNSGKPMMPMVKEDCRYRIFSHHYAEGEEDAQYSELMDLARDRISVSPYAIESCFSELEEKGKKIEDYYMPKLPILAIWISEDEDVILSYEEAKAWILEQEMDKHVIFRGRDLTQEDEDAEAEYRRTHADEIARSEKLMEELERSYLNSAAYDDYDGYDEDQASDMELIDRAIMQELNSSKEYSEQDIEQINEELRKKADEARHYVSDEPPFDELPF